MRRVLLASAVLMAALLALAQTAAPAVRKQAAVSPPLTLGKPPVAVEIGTRLALPWQVSAARRRAASPATFAVLLSSDKKRDKKDVALGTLRTPRVAAGKTKKGTLQLAVSARTQPGLYVVLACPPTPKAKRGKPKPKAPACRSTQAFRAVAASVAPAPSPVLDPAPGGGGGGSLPPTPPSGDGVAPPVAPPTTPPTTPPQDPPTDPPDPPDDPPTDSPFVPPDPAAVAPTLNETSATSLFDAASFLFEGDDPVQPGVEEDAIEPERIAVLHGRALNRAGEPLAGVRVRVLDHPELGHTGSREDGRFDLAVNGGGELTAVYERAGYLPVQRTETVPWQDYEGVPDVVMTPIDTAAADVDVDDGGVAMGTPVSDGDGTRQAVLSFDPGTDATMTMPNGDERPLPDDLDVRATEFTVGGNGGEAMPGELPATSGYTYAADFTVDQAAAAGAVDVELSKPVAVYVDNFLGFPAGTVVPVGFYDDEKAAWIPSKSGVVIDVVGVESGRARLDVTGDGQADPAAALTAHGVDDAELVRIAGLYGAGASLWRFEVDHFSTWDANWGTSPPDDAEAPNVGAPSAANPSCTNQQPGGSTIGCEDRTLGERIAIPGTEHVLSYRSDRVPGRADARSVEIPLSGSSIPPSVKRIDVEIDLAGRRFSRSFAPAANLRHAFRWDGRDAYGRQVNGSVEADIRIGYAYEQLYAATSRFRNTGGAPITGERGRGDLTLWGGSKVTLGSWDASRAGLGGWTLEEHHAYDPGARVLYMGDGTQRSAAAESTRVPLTRLAGTGNPGFRGDGDEATEAWLDSPGGVALAPDGRIVFADSGNNRVRAVAPDGEVETVAGTGGDGEGGDGGPATDATLRRPMGVALGPDGSVYVADEDGNRVRRIRPDGRIATAAGGGSPADGTGDGGMATDARLSGPTGVAVATDGTLYVADRGANRVRRVMPDGAIDTLAGTGDPGFRGDGGLATLARLRRPSAVAVDRNGYVYVADSLNDRVRAVAPDGTIETVAGGGSPPDGVGDGGPPTEAALNQPGALALGSDGSLLVADTGHGRIRRVSADQRITTAVGGGTSSNDGQPSLRARLDQPAGLVAARDGSLYVSERAGHRVRKVGTEFPGFQVGDLAVPSRDGAELFQFDSSGRHQRTFDTLTGALVHAFGYDARGRLTSIRDAHGNVTTVVRGGDGSPSAIVGPFGQRTELSVDADGYLDRVEDPTGAEWGVDYGAGGLLTDFTNPNGHTAHMAYDSDGHLTSDTNAAGERQTLTAAAGDDIDVTHRSAEGRATRYEFEQAADGEQRQTVTYPDGTRETTSFLADGSLESTAPDGTRFEGRFAPDPRFGLLTRLIASGGASTPGGLRGDFGASRTALTGSSGNPLDLESLTQTATVNGRSWQQTYAGTDRRLATASPRGRTGAVTFDATARPTQSTTSGLAPRRLGYDSRGRLNEITTGHGVDARTETLAYDARGFLSSITGSLGEVVAMENDAAGRMTSVTLPGGARIAQTRDAAGNLVALTPPGRPSYGFDYDAAERMTAVHPPDVGDGDQPTTVSYTDEGRVARIDRPGEAATELHYDAGGHLDAIDSAAGDYEIATHAATGMPSSATAPGGVRTDYGWDGRLPTSVTWSGPVEGAYRRTYSQDFVPTMDTVDGAGPGAAVAYGYDSDGLLTRAGDLVVTHDSQNELATATAIGAVETSNTHNAFGELASTSARHGSHELYEAIYSRDRIGRTTERRESVAGDESTERYEYDAAGRLARVEVDGSERARYSYDANGNRTSVVTPSGTVTSIYDAQDRLLSAGTTSYAYSAAGDLARRTRGGATTDFDYDPFGNLRRVDLPGGQVVRYVIDAEHRRVGKTVDGQLEQGFLYLDRRRPVAELDGDGAVRARFVYAGDENLPAYMVRGGETYRLVADQLGSVRLVVRVSDGAVVQRIDYDEFGVVLSDTNPGFQPFGFAGGLYDPDTGLVRFGARDYDPEIGRFTTKDPLGFKGGSPNLYMYALGEPVNLTDPSGELSPAVIVVAPVLGSLIGEGIVAGYYFLDNYFDMRRANTRRADKYFHCMANCQAAQLGLGGYIAAWTISEARERWDAWWKGDSAEKCEADHAANRHGRGAGGANPDLPCRELCNSHRPPRGLDPRY